MVRNNNLDWLKFILALMVAGIHYGEYLPLGQFSDFMLVNGLFRIAVPIFFIFNGYFIYNAMQKGKTINYVKRIIYLYLFWSFIYLFFFLTIEHPSPQALLSNFAFGFYHLWYLPAVIMASLILILTDRAKDNTRIFSFLCLFIIGTSIQYCITTNSFPAIEMNILKSRSFIYRNGLFFAPVFMLMGYLINKHKLAEKSSNRKILWFMVSGLLLLVLETFFNAHYPQAQIDMMFSLLLFCPALFLFIMKINKQLPALNGDIPNAIYFIHPFVKFSAEYLNLKINHTLLTYSAVITIIVLLFIRLPTKIKKIVL